MQLQFFVFFWRILDFLGSDYKANNTNRLVDCQTDLTALSVGLLLVACQIVNNWAKSHKTHARD